MSLTALPTPILYYPHPSFPLASSGFPVLRSPGSHFPGQGRTLFIVELDVLLQGSTASIWHSAFHIRQIIHTNTVNWSEQVRPGEMGKTTDKRISGRMAVATQIQRVLESTTREQERQQWVYRSFFQVQHNWTHTSFWLSVSEAKNYGLFCCIASV